MKQPEALISLEEAAELLGYSVSGLRKIINRSRRRLRGEPTVGATISFFQAGPQAPIKFKRQWIDDFIRQHTQDPSRSDIRPPEQLRKLQAPAIEILPPDTGLALGFNPTLYDV